MNLAINGFGRIGRQALRIIQDKFPDINVVLINDLTDVETLAHLFEFDSTYGRFQSGKVKIDGKYLVTGNDKILISVIKMQRKI